MNFTPDSIRPHLMIDHQLWRRSLAAASLIAFFSFAHAFDTPASSQIRALEFHDDSLWWGSVSRPVDALPTPIRNDLTANLDRLGVRQEQAQFDLRSGRWATLIITRPLIPGNGVGNQLGWSDLGRDTPSSLAEREAAIWQAFSAFLMAHRDELGFAAEEFGEATITQHGVLPAGQHTGHQEGRLGSRLVQIHLARQVNGVPVRDSDITAVINSGNLVLMGQRNWADIDLDTRPSLDAEMARQALSLHLGGIQPDRDRESPRLVIVPVADEANEDAVARIGDGLDFRLVWVFSPHFDADIGTWEALVDAHSGELLSFQDINHYAQQRTVQGGKFPVSNDGSAPDGVEQAGFPMPYADIRVGATQVGFATTGGVVPAAAGAGPFSTTLTGQYVRINDNCGAVNASTDSGDLDLGTGVGTNCQVPPGSSAGNTRSARTTYYGLNRIQEQARGYLPNNNWLNQRLTANMNVNNTCNATWNGTAVNFFRAGNGCSNTGELMPVVHHEWGHGMDANDGNPGVSRPGEGIADIFAQNLLVDSCIGRNFQPGAQCGGFGDPCLQCTGVRESDWARQTSGQPHDIAWVLSPISSPGGGCVGTGNTANAPCGTSVHCEGSIIAEALWDLVHRDLRGFNGSAFNLDLNTALELGTRLTYLGSHLVGAWYQCNPGSGTGNGCNAAGGYLNFLAADDDNGDLTDGTPHMSAIFAAFNRHGLACNNPPVQDSGCGTRPQSAPADVSAVSLDGSVALSWEPVADAEEYWVFRSESVKGCDFGKALVGRTTATSFLESGLRNDFGLLYNVMAVGGQDSCSGPMSACVEVTPSAGPSGALAGTIRHRSTDELLAGVLIEAEGSESVTFGTLSGAVGAYQMRLPVGSYQIQFSAPGFQPEAFAVEILEDGELTLDVNLEAPVIAVSPENIELTLPIGAAGEAALGLSNPSGLTLDWTIYTDSARQVLMSGYDPALDEQIPLPNFQLASSAAGGSPVVIELPAGLASRGDVLGFRFQGTVTGVSGTQSWASDMCLLVQAPDGQSFGVGGFSGSQGGCNVNPWDFNGNQSANNGSYESLHAEVFDPAAPDQGNWRFTFINDWTSAQAATMSWTNVSITLRKQALPICVQPGQVDWISVMDPAGETPSGELRVARLLIDSDGLEAGRHEAELCVASTDPLRSLLAVPVGLELVAAVAPAELSLSAAVLDFGDVPPGSSADLSLTLTNAAGAGALALTLPQPLVDGQGAFTLSGGDCQFPAELAPGASCSLGLRFQPEAVADYAASLWVMAGNGQLAEVELTGLGRVPDPVFRDRFEPVPDGISPD